jgi:hypothetical protein
MCMIAFRPARPGKHGSNIPTQVIDLAMNRHPDGFGIAWREQGGLRVERFGPRERNAFGKAIRRIDRLDVEYVAHFRFATHGPKDREHAHPYEYADPIEGRVLVFHNGVIDLPTAVRESDTEVFVRDVLAHLPSRWWALSGLRYLVGEAIGWSRIVVMTARETVNLQERDGEWDGGLWYSSEHRAYRSTGRAHPTILGSYPPKALPAPEPEACTNPALGRVYRVEGHVFEPTCDIPTDRGDRELDGALVCAECGEQVDVLVMDGTVYPLSTGQCGEEVAVAG